MPESKRLVWDEAGKRFYETGVDRGVLYPFADNPSDSAHRYDKGVAWNGLTAVNESPSGAEPTPLYADNLKYLNLYSAEDFGGTIEAYTYPDEFGPCNGEKELAPGVFVTQQKRKSFGFCYRTLIGNDTEGTKAGYKIHVVYGATASPSEKSNNTVNESPEAQTLSWTFSTIAEIIQGFEPSAHLIIDSRTLTTAQLKAVEDVLYGTDNVDPRIILPNEFTNIIGAESAG